MSVQNFGVLAVLLSLFCCVYSTQKQVQSPQWYITTNFPSKIPDNVDFRGCYEKECIYIANSPVISSSDRILAKFDSSQKLWGVQEENSTSVSWIFSHTRPEETSSTLWIYPIPNSRIVHSFFNSEPYIRDAPDPLVARVVSEISEEQIRAYVSHLAMNFHTRNSYSDEATQAAQYLELRMTELGCSAARLSPYNPNFSPNVVCELEGYDPDAPIVVVGAHYDSRGLSTSNPTERAPGADDNGSGSSGLLEILRAIVTATGEGISFRRKIIFILFSGEEQGLLGSAAIASEFVNQGVPIIAMVNMDMIGFPEINQPTTLWWKARGVNTNLTNLGISLTRTYLGEDTQISTSVSCCSDMQSFTERGYPAAGVFEATAGTNNPNYHKPTDLPDTITYSHALRTTQMAAALIATMAEPRASGFVVVNE